MPLYKIRCNVCKSESRKLLSLDKRASFNEACPICDNPLVMVFGNVQERSLETRDDYRNKKAVVGVEQMITERADEHYKKVELPKIISEKGLGYAVEHHLVDPNDL